MNFACVAELPENVVFDETYENGTYIKYHVGEVYGVVNMCSHWDNNYGNISHENAYIDCVYENSLFHMKRTDSSYDIFYKSKNDWRLYKAGRLSQVGKLFGEGVGVYCDNEIAIYDRTIEVPDKIIGINKISFWDIDWYQVVTTNGVYYYTWWWEYLVGPIDANHNFEDNMIRVYKENNLIQLMSLQRKDKEKAWESAPSEFREFRNFDVAIETLTATTKIDILTLSYWHYNCWYNIGEVVIVDNSALYIYKYGQKRFVFKGVWENLTCIKSGNSVFLLANNVTLATVQVHEKDIDYSRSSIEYFISKAQDVFKTQSGKFICHFEELKKFYLFESETSVYSIRLEINEKNFKNAVKERIIDGKPVYMIISSNCEIEYIFDADLNQLYLRE
jgi:hypothetical protein